MTEEGIWEGPTSSATATNCQEAPVPYAFDRRGAWGGAGALRGT